MVEVLPKPLANTKNILWDVKLRLGAPGAPPACYKLDAVGDHDQAKDVRVKLAMWVFPNAV